MSKKINYENKILNNTDEKKEKIEQKKQQEEKEQQEQKEQEEKQNQEEEITESEFINKFIEHKTHNLEQNEIDKITKKILNLDDNFPKNLFNKDDKDIN